MTASSTLQIFNWLEAAARSLPDKLALTFAGRQWTFTDLCASVAAAEVMLSGTRRESAGRIGILSLNRPGIVFTVHAATRMGIPFVPLNSRQTAEEIAWQLRNAGVTLLVVDEQRANLAKRASAGLPVEIVQIEDLECSTPTEERRGAVPLIDLAREAMVIYTSGTSGRPKGARITYGNLWYGAVASSLHIGHLPTDSWLAAMPLFHVGGLAILFRAAIGAVPVVLHERFAPEPALAAIEDGVTLVSVVPTMLERMVEARGTVSWPAHLRCVLLGGSAAPQRLVEACIRRGIPVAPTYGLTEATSQVTTLLPGEASRKVGSSGVPLPLTELRIVAQTGAAAPGETGEIEIRGPTLFAGYIDGNPRASSDRNDGWFRTGDVGYLDKDGYLYVLDRRDDLIVSGGENIYPAEIERVLRQHPSVLDAGVIGIADESWGNRPVAAVVWRGDRGRAIMQLLDHCREYLPGYKVPDRFFFRDELPRSASGKLLRRALREIVARSL